MRGVILLGAPGAGKGTVAETVLKRSSLIHLSTGDLLRRNIKNGTELGRQAESFMKQGQLVPDAVILSVVEAELSKAAEDTAFLFDGFPRTAAQLTGLDVSMTKHGGAVSHVIFLDTPRDLLIMRLTGRRLCRDCGASYHIRNIPPKKEGVCDQCGGALYQRPDDAEETIVKRLDVFKAETEGLIAMYDLRGILYRLDATKPIPQQTDEVLAICGAA